MNKKILLSLSLLLIMSSYSFADKALLIEWADSVKINKTKTEVTINLNSPMFLNANSMKIEEQRTFEKRKFFIKVWFSENVKIFNKNIKYLRLQVSKEDYKKAKKIVKERYEKNKK